MKRDVPGYVDVKFAIIAPSPSSWVDTAVELGTVRTRRAIGEWTFQMIETQARHRDLVVRLFVYAATPEAAANDPGIGLRGADAVLAEEGLDLPVELLAVAMPCVVVKAAPARQILLEALAEALQFARDPSTADSLN
jgi:hypothetical protein